MVDAVETEKKKENGKCPNCEKDITLEEIKAICTGKIGNKEICLIEDDTLIKEAIPYLNKYRKKVAINTCLTKAHFLAQISQESKFFQTQERFKYTKPERMKALFISYFNQFENDKDKEAKRLSELSLDKKNWPEIANAIYGPTHPEGKRSGHNNTDGWRYSGKGFKQITWKKNYETLEKYAKDNFGVEVIWVGGENPYKLKNNPKDAILSALAYWENNEVWKVADEIEDSNEKTLKR
ncbi:hypothetical protein EG240_15230 [Paenimyroides tangerinum]|uniref:Chitinase n=1 Tax=Paenimyroides tangerinum TaxID=2488728 RepID=A0A3P3VX59_9FLAO|nr:hypothetical protein [Paenimyroides tangerinum]RRJ87375.1 hypothetical protein EG240_15230 [Paenimyroides tangerinum]